VKAIIFIRGNRRRQNIARHTHRRGLSVAIVPDDLVGPAATAVAAGPKQQHSIVRDRDRRKGLLGKGNILGHRKHVPCELRGSAIEGLGHEDVFPQKQQLTDAAAGRGRGKRKAGIIRQDAQVLGAIQRSDTASFW
jgi:hypothetical protein